ncbi:hypothetical protein [Longispora albida]|uniref:hypothetical protein n=1 Tax=Longispora albida TaxID=203523 RepID=UPI00036C71F7|nr:hypothetical protein [Longispora albida]
MKPHRTDAISLVFGLLFSGVAAWWWLSQVIELSPAVAGWCAAIALMVLGVIGIVTALTTSRRQPLPVPQDHPEDQNP